MGQPVERPVEQPVTLDAHIQLRRDAFSRHPNFVAHAQTNAKIREKLAPTHVAGTVHVLQAEGETVGVFAWRHDDDPWEGSPVSEVYLDYVPGHPAVPAWLAESLDAELPRMEADLKLILDRSYFEAYAALKARGVGVEATLFLADPSAARKHLRADRPIAPLPAPLSLVPFHNRWLQPLFELRLETFRESPEFCWFGTNAAYLARSRALIEKEIGEPDACHFAVLDDGRFAGYVSAPVEHDNPFWGPTGAMSLLFSPALRGRGLLRAVYDHLLSEMIERGASTFKGLTSQAPVLRLSNVMKRRLHAVSMRRIVKFDEAHFAPFILAAYSRTP